MDLHRILIGIILMHRVLILLRILDIAGGLGRQCGLNKIYA